MKKLIPSMFDDYLLSIYNHQTFRWQRRLVQFVLQSQKWPDILDLPTSVGKTSALDIAIFHLASEALQGSKRTAPLRIVYMVDRKTVLDQAFIRACLIAKSLMDRDCLNKWPILKFVSESLASLSSRRIPLKVALLRGGIVRDTSWISDPRQPVIILSTVDQVGSQILFRGYGISESMRPIHAGLLGNDALFLFDEVHISQPFCQTLLAIDKYREWAEQPIMPNLWQMVCMSATIDPNIIDTDCSPISQSKKQMDKYSVFRLNQDDENDHALMTRLNASKPTRLREIKVKGEEHQRQASFVAAFVDEVKKQALKPGKVIGVNVNRVSTAREIFKGLPCDLMDRFLLTGRMRPLDRQELEAKLFPLVQSDRSRDINNKPTVIVSTQCTEVGADFDFDVLITECAPFNVLRQRFGRLDRIGNAKGNAYGVILIRSDQIIRKRRPKKGQKKNGEGKTNVELNVPEDPIYGKALAETWNYLKTISSLDFGIRSLQLPQPEQLVHLLSPKKNAPILLPAHLDLLVQTKPSPYPNPDVSLFLHGPDCNNPDVYLAWRADITKQQLLLGIRDTNMLEIILSKIKNCKPSNSELLSLPISIVREWLANLSITSIADVEGSLANLSITSIADVEGSLTNKINSNKLRPALAWRGNESIIITNSSDILPGDVLIIPTEYGGLSSNNWDPEAVNPVFDIAEQTSLYRYPMIRLHTAVLKDIISEGLPNPPIPAGIEEDDYKVKDRKIVLEWFTCVSKIVEVPEWFKELIKHIQNDLLHQTCQFIRISHKLDKADNYFIILSKTQSNKYILNNQLSIDECTIEDDFLLTGKKVLLQDHQDRVAIRAADFATRCGLPDNICSDILLSGRFHDIGKSDPRFQCLLHGGSFSKSMVATDLLAKSILNMNQKERRMAAKRAGYPSGTRHELLSVALLQSFPQIQNQSKDWDLVLHLLGSHHGYCRPFVPYVEENQSLNIQCKIGQFHFQASNNHGLECLDSGISERFWRLIRRYGWWGQALLETIFRLADMYESNIEQHATFSGDVS